MKFDETLTLCVKSDLKTAQVPMLLGEPGIGKSSWVEALARSMGTECFTLACNQLADKADLTGARLVPHGDSYAQVFYPHAVIQNAINYANEHPDETPILFLDELNRTTPDVTSEALSIPTLRQIGNAKLPHNLRVITAGNDKGNVTALDEASISRFVLYRVEPDIETFLGLDENLNPHVRAVLERSPRSLFCKTMELEAAPSDDDTDVDDERTFDDAFMSFDERMEQITTPRTVMNLSRFMNHLGDDNLIELMRTEAPTAKAGESENMLSSVIVAHVGKTAFSTLLIDHLMTHLVPTATTTATFKVSRPDRLDEVAHNSTVVEMENTLSSWTPAELQGALVYLLSSDEGYKKANLMRAISQKVTSLEADSMHSLMKLCTLDMLDRQSVEVYLDTNTALSNQLSIILNS